jgi:hypothetical protein
MLINRNIAENYFLLQAEILFGARDADAQEREKAAQRRFSSGVACSSLPAMQSDCLSARKLLPQLVVVIDACPKKCCDCEKKFLRTYFSQDTKTV